MWLGVYLEAVVEGCAALKAELPARHGSVRNAEERVADSPPFAAAEDLHRAGRKAVDVDTVHEPQRSLS